MIKQLLLATTMLTLSLTAQATDFAGQVVGVIDGDTVDVLSPDLQKHRVRLISIDAPERSQAFGTRSKQALSEMIYGQQVDVVDHGKDMYGRQLGEVMMGKISANKTMVRLGMAWAYRPKLLDNTYVEIENGARQAKRGLWVDPNPVAPWTYRRDKRQKPSTSAASH